MSATILRAAPRAHPLGNRTPAYVPPSLAEARAAGLPRPLLTLAVAGWMRHLPGVAA